MITATDMAAARALPHVGAGIERIVHRARRRAAAAVVGSPRHGRSPR